MLTKPQKPYKFSPDQLILHALWKKAYKDGEVLVPVTSTSDARKLRFALYNAVKPIKDERAYMPELAEAVAACSVSADESGVRIQHKAKTLILQNALGVLGKDLSTVLQENEAPTMTQEEAESTERMKKILETQVQPARATPYYSRED